MDKSKNTPPMPDTIVKRVENLLLDGEELLLATQPALWRIQRNSFFWGLLMVTTMVGIVIFFSPMLNDAKANNIRYFYLAVFGVFELMGLYPLLVSIQEYRN